MKKSKSSDSKQGDFSDKCKLYFETLINIRTLKTL